MMKFYLICIIDFKTLTMRSSTETIITSITPAITDTTEFTSTQKSDTKESTTKQTNSPAEFDIGSNTLLPGPTGKFNTDITFTISTSNNPKSNFHFTTAQSTATDRNPTNDLSTEGLWQTVLFLC